MTPLYPPTKTEMGALCHFRPGAFPVAAITNLNGDIIVSNVQYEADPGKSKPLWVISSVKVIITRFWACSQAQITLTCSVPNLDQLPPPLPPFFRIEQDLCIYLGYLDEIRPVVKPDLGFRLLRVFIGIIDTFSRTITDTGGITVKIQCRDRMKWLMDSVITMAPQGSSNNLSAVGNRRVNGGDSIPRSDLILDIARRSIGEVNYKDPVAGDRVNVNLSCMDCGRKIIHNAAFVYDAALDSAFRSVDVWYRENTAPLQGKTRTDDHVIPANPDFRIYTARQAIKLKENLQFLVTQKIPIEIIKVLALQEVHPTEVFQSHVDGHFYYVPRSCDVSSLTDPKRFYRTYYVRNVPSRRPFVLNPTEQMPTGAEVVYGQRDRPVNYRGYILKENERGVNGVIERRNRDGVWERVNPQPKLTQPSQQNAAQRSLTEQRVIQNIEQTPFTEIPEVDFNQMVLRYKEEFTSVGLKTNIQVRVMQDMSQAQQLAYAVHLRAYPWDLKRPDATTGSKPKFGCKITSWEDDTISNLAEAAVVALNLAKQYSREVRAATGVLLGDPSLTPGEVCQVIAPPMFETEDWIQQIQNDRRQFFVYHTRNLSTAQDYEAKIRAFTEGQKTLTLPVYDGTEAYFIKDEEATKDERAFLCKDTSKVWDRKDIGFNEEPRSIWRVEAVIHNFNVGAQGYRTEVAWVTPF